MDPTPTVPSVEEVIATMSTKPAYANANDDDDADSGHVISGGDQGGSGHVISGDDQGGPGTLQQT